MDKKIIAAGSLLQVVLACSVLAIIISIFIGTVFKASCELLPLEDEQVVLLYFLT
ncbi:hypothetical protein OQJ19_10110 [Fluoribacter gormanii]|nr:hypothetical protein [Fluoribacter gormanii]